MFPKSRPVRSESYRRWVATLACMGMTKDTRDELEDKYIAQTQALGREAGRRELKDAA